MIILIADDDKLIRFTMKSMLNDILTTHCTFIEAANGRELVQLTRKNLPDIAFVDIKMPHMDGLTAIEECKKISDSTEYVIISGYSDFEYAKRCITLNVTDYLLKPVEEQALKEILDVLQKKLDHSKNQSNASFRLNLLHAFNYLSTIGNELEFEEPQLKDYDIYFVFGAFFLYHISKQPHFKQLQSGFVDQMNRFGKSTVKQHLNYSLVYSNEGTPYFVFRTPAEYGNTLFYEIKKIASEINASEMLLSMIFFQERSFPGIYNMCELLDKNHTFCIACPGNTVLQYASIKYTEKHLEYLALLSKLLDAYQDADEILFKNTMNQFCSTYTDCPSGLNLNQIAQNMSLITGCSFDSTSFQLFCKSAANMNQSIHSNIVKADSDIIVQIKSYIQKNYASDISINQIADLFELTPNYLSSIFHQKAKLKFIDYLTDIRIMNAKKLLIQNNTASVKDISLMVGYNSPRHFSALFQKMTGMTPSAYRRLIES